MRYVSMLIMMFFPLLTVSTAVNANEDSAFVKGFIHGAMITDETIVTRLEISDKELSAFEERAFRTRLGLRDRTQPATYYAGFCLPTSVNLNTVAAAILKDIGDKTVDGTSVYSAVKNLYPCSSVKEKK